MLSAAPARSVVMQGRAAATAQAPVSQMQDWGLRKHPPRPSPAPFENRSRDRSTPEQPKMEFPGGPGPLHPLLATCPSRKDEASCDMGAEGPASPRDVDQVSRSLGRCRRAARRHPRCLRRAACCQPACRPLPTTFHPLPQEALRTFGGLQQDCQQGMQRCGCRLLACCCAVSICGTGSSAGLQQRALPCQPAGRPAIDTQGPAGSRVPDLDDRRR